MRYKSERDFLQKMIDSYRFLAKQESLNRMTNMAHEFFTGTDFIGSCHVSMTNQEFAFIFQTPEKNTITEILDEKGVKYSITSRGVIVHISDFLDYLIRLDSSILIQTLQVNDSIQSMEEMKDYVDERMDYIEEKLNTIIENTCKCQNDDEDDDDFDYLW